MKEFRSQTTRIYPNELQENYFNDCIKLNVDMYNHLVDIWEEDGKKNKSYFRLLDELNDVKFENEDFYSSRIKYTCARRFHFALTKLSLKQNRQPKKHKYNAYKSSFTLPLPTKSSTNKNGLVVIDNKFYFKIQYGQATTSEWITDRDRLCLMSEELKFDYSNYQAKTVTIFKKADEWYANFQIEVDIIPEVVVNQPIDKIGIDLGTEIYGIGYTSDGKVVHINWSDELLKKVARLEDRIKANQKLLAKKIKNSNSFLKSKKIIEKLYIQIQNIKEDFLKKKVRELCKTYKEINLETLSIKSMVKRGKRTIKKETRRKIYGQKWNFFTRFIKHKAREFKVIVNFCKPNFKSTQTCSNCGSIKKMTLNMRQYDCPKCGYSEDRDINAAINIYNYV